MIDHAAIVSQMGRTLGSMDRWFDKAFAHAKAKSFDADVLLQCRLAPDMFPLVRQIGSACDNAKFAAARLAGKTPPSHPDVEKTWDEIRLRVRDVGAYVASFAPADFAGASERTMSLRFAPGKVLAGDDYLVRYAVPNFLFHVSMTYAILRHNGVDLGKTDYLGELPFRDA